MKKVFLAAALLAASAGVFSFSGKFADSYTVDLAKSKVDWSGSADNRYHPGTVMLKSGSVSIDNGKITGGKLVFDLTTIKPTDGSGERLENHLKSADFFDVAQFGEATYDVTSVNYTSDNVAQVSGNLLVKGVAFPLSFPVKVRGLKDGKLFAEAYFTLDSAPFSKRPYGVEIAAHLFANK
ncbi:YceI family protein [Sediminibacterium soli]|uniref:YceI family protein n=1 Tax=Sediminibacterium soli TaxID=2698829 RepID=UPI001379FB00|nr:YceI family protein [Sediminibacterium soli]NCI46878.1 YceI family protein [Sediminibacterium soli]